MKQPNNMQVMLVIDTINDSIYDNDMLIEERHRFEALTIVIVNFDSDGIGEYDGIT